VVKEVRRREERRERWRRRERERERAQVRRGGWREGGRGGKGGEEEEEEEGEETVFVVVFVVVVFVERNITITPMVSLPFRRGTRMDPSCWDTSIGPVWGWEEFAGSLAVVVGGEGEEDTNGYEVMRSAARDTPGSLVWGYDGVCTLV